MTEAEPVGAKQSGVGRYLIVLIVGLAFGVVLSALAGVLIIGPLAVGHRADLPLERVYGKFAVSLASRMNGGQASSPVVQSTRGVQAGRLAYIGSCAECHGANGDGKGVFGSATYPPATDLTTGDPKEMSDAQLYWIIKNGLSFTGMPSFGGQYNDQDLWSLVAYIRALQKPATASSTAISVPAPTVEQLAAADPHGSQVQRGAATYFAQGCAECHGAVGVAPGDLRLRGGERGVIEAVRNGRRGMPAYSAAVLSDQDLADVGAYFSTFSTARTGGGEGGGGESTGR